MSNSDSGFEFLKSVEDDYKNRMNAFLEQAPSQFVKAFDQLVIGNLSTALEELAGAVPYLIEHEKSWAGTAMCCYAYCLKEAGQHSQAIRTAELGYTFSLNLVGFWYYHHVMVHSQNHVDNLSGALKAAETAVDFFRTENSLGNVADHLSLKANILKQMAAYTWLDPEKAREARTSIVGSIRAICDSLSLSSYGWELELREELKQISSIAGRLRISSDDISFLDSRDSIRDIVNLYFSGLALSRNGALSYYNLAIQAREHGHREEASEYFDNAIDLAPESEIEDRAFKALIAYQYGVNLLKQHSLEGVNPYDSYNADTRLVIGRIKKLWQIALDIYDGLNQDFLRDFNERFPPGLTDAVWNIRRDPIMQFST